MRREAKRRLDDAQLLEAGKRFQEDTDSSYLLRLLAFELLLKLVHELSLPGKAYGHKYQELFSDLPRCLQARLLDLAGQRVGPSFLASPADVLRTWGDNFVALRYPYDRYKGMSEAEYSERGDAWVDRGAPLEEATFRYYPEELVGLLYALEIAADELIDTRLEDDRGDH